MAGLVETDGRQFVELRIPGIGGPVPESVLGCPPGSAFVHWQSGFEARSTVRRGAGAPTTFVYDWRTLTSGSRSFALWPLLLPYTLGNVVGFMAPDAGRVRVATHRVAAVLFNLVLTASTVVWLLLAAVSVWGMELSESGLPTWVPGDADAAEWAFWLAAASVAIVMAGLVVAATYVADGFERFRREVWGRTLAWRGLWGSSVRRRLDDQRFFDNERDHAVRWRIHALVAAATWLVLVVAVVLVDGPGRPQRVIDHAVAVMAAATAAPVLLLAASSLWQVRRLGWRLVAPAVAVLAATLLGGGVLSALIAFVGIESVPSGPAGMLFDVLGWSLLAALFAGVGVTVFGLLSPSAAERHDASRALLRSLAARLRARLAVAPSRLGVAVVAFALAFAVGTVVAFFVRWLPEDERRSWTLTPTAPVDVARLTVVFLVAFMFLNVVKKLGNPAALRRVGNVWDVLTFWPRTFHPFAVRPYAERAVPELQDFLALTSTPSRATREVVVLAHSQGSVLAYAALVPSRAAGDAVSEAVRLVTVGSPLRSLYGAAFPLYVREADLRAAIGGWDGHPRLAWTNVFRFTDHVGRAVFASDDAVAADAGRGLAPEAGDEPRPRWADRPIPDPIAGRGVMGHNDYWSDLYVFHEVQRARMRAAEEVAGDSQHGN